ncbi:hypothetical protein FOG51_01207 [Hanseniaspora uvarum]|mgnify:CR=1 FL=1|uniref:Protein FMP32, mitochondrial n=1 Tax=Hanseniaspora uvarum TaxID=29833 RepID=A0A1E5RPK9_HANUV|nr:hypothetical protein FOG48_02555 [Hanseniaspora uvarum]KAF0273636.1 hypothetical protein FOG51_01207 [Hanseniaspora uvarum]KAF0275641.1 hypothetical protein FOG50_03508 [Hanseniaspora uvarum]KKA02196.1 Protein FMP32, mitochondrial [Hanseniaspora uvarum DSM 2768]OEJ88831.1 Protein FMP32, mitochondrial [Hanseniaspora uvarum]
MIRLARLPKYRHKINRLYSLQQDVPKNSNINGFLEGSNMNEQYIADQLIKDQIFSKEQVDRLFKVYKKNMGAVTKKRIEKENLATREEIIKMIQIKTNSFNKIENEIIIDHLDKIKEYKQEIISLTSDLEKLQKNFNMEIRKCNGAFKLDLSLEKGRIKEINSNQELKIKDIDTKLSEEINNINTKIEANKTQLIQWMYTIVFAAIGIILAFFRLIS